MRNTKCRVHVPAAKLILAIGYILSLVLIFWMAPEKTVFLGAPPDMPKTPFPMLNTASSEHKVSVASTPEIRAEPEVKPRRESRSPVKSVNDPSTSRTKPAVVPRTKPVAAPRANAVSVPRVPAPMQTRQPEPSVKVPVNLPGATPTRVPASDVKVPALPSRSATPGLEAPRVDLPSLPGQAGAALVSPGAEMAYEADGWRQIPIGGNRHEMDQAAELLWLDVKRLLMNRDLDEFLTDNLRILRTAQGNFMLFISGEVNLHLALQQGLRQLRT
jgi:hypothetical protein